MSFKTTIKKLMQIGSEKNTGIFNLEDFLRLKKLNTMILQKKRIILGKVSQQNLNQQITQDQNPYPDIDKIYSLRRSFRQIKNRNRYRTSSLEDFTALEHKNALNFLSTTKIAKSQQQLNLKSSQTELRSKDLPPCLNTFFWVCEDTYYKSPEIIDADISRIEEKLANKDNFQTNLNYLKINTFKDLKENTNANNESLNENLSISSPSNKDTNSYIRYRDEESNYLNDSIDSQKLFTMHNKLKKETSNNKVLENFFNFQKSPELKEFDPTEEIAFKDLDCTSLNKSKYYTSLDLKDLTNNLDNLEETSSLHIEGFNDIKNKELKINLNSNALTDDIKRKRFKKNSNVFLEDISNLLPEGNEKKSANENSLLKIEKTDFKNNINFHKKSLSNKYDDLEDPTVMSFIYEYKNLVAFKLEDKSFVENLETINSQDHFFYPENLKNKRNNKNLKVEKEIPEVININKNLTINEKNSEKILKNLENSDKTTFENLTTASTKSIFVNSKNNKIKDLKISEKKILESLNSQIQEDAIDLTHYGFPSAFYVKSSSSEDNSKKSLTMSPEGEKNLDLEQMPEDKDNKELINEVFSTNSCTEITTIPSLESNADELFQIQKNLKNVIRFNDYVNNSFVDFNQQHKFLTTSTEPSSRKNTFLNTFQADNSNLNKPPSSTSLLLFGTQQKLEEHLRELMKARAVKNDENILTDSKRKKKERKICFEEVDLKRIYYEKVKNLLNKKFLEKKFF